MANEKRLSQPENTKAVAPAKKKKNTGMWIGLAAALQAVAAAVQAVCRSAPDHPDQRR